MSQKNYQRIPSDQRIWGCRPLTFETKKVLVVAKTYPNLSQKYDRTVCTAGIDLTCGKWIRIFPIRFFDLDYHRQQFRKYEIIELEVEKTNDKFMRKESHKANDASIKIIEHLDTSDNWNARKKLLMPLLSKSIEELENNYEKDHTSLGIIKPKRIIDFKATPIEACRPWEKDLILGIQQTLDGINYQSPLEKIPYKFSYVFECDDPNCTTRHDLMIEDWEICQLYRYEKQRVGEQEALKKVVQKYKDEFLTKKDLSFIIGTESKWNKWLIISVFYPKKE
jgi:hypothetical protein